MILIICIIISADLNYNFIFYSNLYRKLFSNNIHVSLLNSRYCRWNCLLLRPAASAARFASTTTRVRPSCSLPLDAIIQGGSLPALPACRAYINVYVHACRRVRAIYVYTCVMYASSKQIQARASHFRRCRLLHTVCSSRWARVLLHS